MLTCDSSILTVDGYFCGAGGLEAAFKQAIAHLGIDATLRIGVNHWDIAIQAFSANCPEAQTACLDVQYFDPTQFGKSDIGLLAPACEKFSRGRGISDNYDQQVIQLSLWEAEAQSLKEKQSRGQPYPNHSTNVRNCDRPTSPFIVQMDGSNDARAMSRPMGTVTTSGGAHHFVTLLPGFNAGWLHSYYSRENVSPELNAPVPTVTTQPHHAVVLSPFLSSYYGKSVGASLNEPSPTIPARDRHSLVLPSGEVFDLDDPIELERAIDLCGFRMLNIHEIKRIQGLPDLFVLKGNQQQQGHLAGQAVPLPSAAEIIVKALQISM